MAGSLRRAAMAYHANQSNEEKGVVYDFFKNLDKNGDGKISLLEFESINKNETGKSEDGAFFRNFFQVLNLAGDGYWDYDDFLTCCYVLVTGRLYTCDGCGKLLSENYFTCTQCFHKKCFDLCCDCYQNRRFQHHNDAVFCDNFELLHRFRISEEKSSSTKPWTQVQQSEQREKLRKAQEVEQCRQRIQQYEQRELARKSYSAKTEKAQKILRVLNTGVEILQQLSLG